jgi:hypothetical protein
MSTERKCPVCGETFRDEDFCPVHGQLLVLSSPAPAPAVDEPAAEISLLEPDEGPGAPETGSADKAGRLADFMAKFGLRRRSGAAEAAAEPVRTASPAEDRAAILPPELLAQGWRVSGTVLERPGVDTWPIEMTSNEGTAEARFNRYRSGALTTAGTYDRLMRLAPRCAARVLAHGTVDFGGARADYDVTAAAGSGTPLDQWLGQSTVGEARSLALLPALLQMLEGLDCERLTAVVFEPSQLVHVESGELLLNAAGTLALTAGNDEGSGLRGYRAEFAHSPLLSSAWAAPELRQQCLLSANAALYSVGQVLAAATWGQPLTVTELQSGVAPFGAIADARLARVLMGCLWPEPQGRWSLAELAQATRAGPDALPATSPWASLAPGAASCAFAFAGKSFWRLEDLLATATMPAHWPEATTRLEELLEWASGTSWSGRVQVLRSALARGRSPDWVLVALAATVQPEAPPSWRALSLSDADAQDSLSALAQRALEGDLECRTALSELFAADLRGAFSALSASRPGETRKREK